MVHICNVGSASSSSACFEWRTPLDSLSAASGSVRRVRRAVAFRALTGRALHNTAGHFSRIAVDQISPTTAGKQTQRVASVPWSRCKICEQQQRVL